MIFDQILSELSDLREVIINEAGIGPSNTVEALRFILEDRKRLERIIVNERVKADKARDEANRKIEDLNKLVGSLHEALRRTHSCEEGVGWPYD